jgi:aspartate racemase
MSWESSALYYRIINEAVRQRLGGFHSARCLMHSVDFAEIEALQAAGHWARAAQILAAAAGSLEKGGADFVVLCTNTMHKVADQIQDAVSLPLLHIADATARSLMARGLSRVGLLGTRFTMEDDFYKGRLTARHGLDVMVPDEVQRRHVHDVIYGELVQGKAFDASRESLRRIMADLVQEGAQGIVLGCTELGILLRDGDAPVPMFDTTRIHALAAVERALAD